LLFIGSSFYFFETFEINNLQIYLNLLFLKTNLIHFEYYVVFFLSLLLLIGAIAKSAQLGLHT